MARFSQPRAAVVCQLGSLPRQRESVQLGSQRLSVAPCNGSTHIESGGHGSAATK